MQKDPTKHWLTVPKPLICTGNLSTLLQLLILNKAYYLEIKIGLINESHQIFSRPCSHFGIIFEQEEGKCGIPLYQTWHIVNSITLYHFTSHSIRHGIRHRDYKRIEAASGDESRNKLNKSNGGQI